MKLAFSSAACPDWDVETIITQAAALGAGVELRAVHGDAAQAHDLSRDPSGLLARLREHGVELASIATENCFHWKDAATLARSRHQVQGIIELAGKLGCPHVRVLGDHVPPREQKQATLLRIVGALRELAPLASRHRTTLVLENHGDFASSRDIWFILDAVNHPAVRCCWNPLLSRLAGEPVSITVPRLGRLTSLVRITDATLNQDGTVREYAPPGEGHLEVERCLDLLRGMMYQGYLILDSPKSSVGSLPAPETAIPGALANLKAILERLSATKELTAYKGDKNAPKFAAPPGPAAIKS